jgi:hypothetical protein
MQTEIGKEKEAGSKNPKTITVTLNERPVTFSDHKTTGLEIKQTAIKQGVAIQEDFVLFEVKGNSPLKQVGDRETVTLHEKQVFRATAPDDNS